MEKLARLWLMATLQVNAQSVRVYLKAASLGRSYFSDILHLIPEAHAHADDCTLSFTCEKHERSTTVEHINDTLSLITSMGRR